MSQFTTGAVVTTETIFQLMRQEFLRHLERSPDVPSEKIAAATATLDEFLQFAEHYMGRHPIAALRNEITGYSVGIHTDDRGLQYFLLQPANSVVAGAMNPVLGRPVDATPGMNIEQASMNQGAVPISGSGTTRQGIIDYRQHNVRTGQYVDKRIDGTRPQVPSADPFNS